MTNYSRIKLGWVKLWHSLNFRRLGLALLSLAIILTLWSGLAGEARGSELGQLIQGKLDQVQINAKLPNPNSPVEVVSSVVKAALGVIAIIFFVLIVAAGFRWMTAGGSEEPIKKAKDQIKHALIGLVIVIFSYAITSLVFSLILEQ